MMMMLMITRWFIREAQIHNACEVPDSKVVFHHKNTYCQQMLELVTVVWWKAKAGTVHSVSGCTRGVQVKLWDPLRMRAIPERLRGVFTMKHYTNPRLPYFQGCYIIFTALHAMQTRSSDENSVCPSVRPSVHYTRALWQNGRKICPDLYTIRKNIYPSFVRRMVGGGDPSTCNFGSTDPRWRKIADFQPIILRSSSAVTPSKKSSINANRSTLCAFQWA